MLAVLFYIMILTRNAVLSNDENVFYHKSLVCANLQVLPGNKRLVQPLIAPSTPKDVIFIKHIVSAGKLYLLVKDQVRFKPHMR